MTEDAPGVTSKTPVNLPAPAWQVIQQPPPAPNVPPPPPVVKAVIEAPELPPPVQGEPQFGTAIWAKVFTTELQQPEGLEGLMHNNLEARGIALEKRADGTEMEWQLLQKDPGNPNSGFLELGGQVLDPDAKAVVRRYEFYEYIGAYKAEDHEALPILGDSMADVSEVGAFLGAQNAQALLVTCAGTRNLRNDIRRPQPRRLAASSQGPTCCGTPLRLRTSTDSRQE